MTIQQELPAITVTNSAAAKVRELLEAEGDTSLALRVAVRPGGCSGFSYEMFFDGDIASDDVKCCSEGRNLFDARRVLEFTCN